MIAVETKPVRMTALQWNGPGDAAELGISSYRHGTEVRHGLDTPEGMQRVVPGDWIVVSAGGRARVYSPGEFNHRFNIVEEGHLEQAGP